MSRHASPKRSLGQNFLVDRNISRKIVQALELKPGDNVLEIGPGRGALTEHIAEADPARLVLLEKDDALADALAEKLPGAELRRGDALRFDWSELKGEHGWKLVGNLPYNVASPLIWDIVSQGSFARAVFMVQLEVGQRLKAAPGSGEYGALSVWVQSFARVEMLFKVPPQVFFPKPKVHSAVMQFFSLPPEDRPQAPSALNSTLKMCFQKRRKQLSTILKSHNKENYVEILESLGIPPQARPEELAKEDFQRLANRMGFHFPA